MSLCEEMIAVLKCRHLRIKPNVQIYRVAPTKKLEQVAICKIFEIVQEDCDDIVVALLIDTTVTKKKDLLKLVLQNKEIKNMILLVDEISHPAHKAILEITCIKVEIIKRSEIAWDKSNYCNVQHYEVLTEDQLEKRKIKRENISKMLTTDAIAIQYGFQVGTVVHALETDTYRVVKYEPQKTKKK